MSLENPYQNINNQKMEEKKPEESKNPETKQEAPPAAEPVEKPPENLNESTESPKENQEKAGNQEKNLKLEEIRYEVENIGDALGRGIDEDGLKVPYVEITAENEPERWEGVSTALEKIQPLKESDNEKFHEEHEKIMQEFSKKPETLECKKWEEENKKLRARAEAVLEEFYKNRKIDPNVKLQIDEIGIFGSFRIYSGKEDYKSVIEKDEQLSIQEKISLPEKLEKYQGEMHEFTKFLKEKYFERSNNKN